MMSIFTYLTLFTTLGLLLVGGALPANVVDAPTESSSALTETPANTITAPVQTTTLAKIVARQFEGPASAVPLDLPAYGYTGYGGGPSPESLQQGCEEQMGDGFGC
jgi:hypothetical protein